MEETWKRPRDFLVLLLKPVWLLLFVPSCSINICSFDKIEDLPTNPILILILHTFKNQNHSTTSIV